MSVPCASLIVSENIYEIIAALVYRFCADHWWSGWIVDLPGFKKDRKRQR
jgi:hypothetical protein